MKNNRISARSGSIQAAFVLLALAAQRKENHPPVRELALK
jgi:hypothetical protein